jgi:DNA polymerase-3 subunit beta
MRFTCSQKKLMESINTVQKAVSTRTTLPVLEGILLEAAEGVLKMTATDQSLSIICFADAAIEEEGAVVIPSRLFGEIVKKLYDTDICITGEEGNVVHIEAANSRFRLQGFDAGEYPDVETMEEQDPVEMGQEDLKKIIQKTIFAAAVEETRPILTGALFEIEDKSLTSVCLDGYRLGLVRSRLKNAAGTKKVVIPGRALFEISKIIGGEDNTVNITLGEKKVLFDLGYTRIITKLLDGEFINYSQIIPNEHLTRVKVDHQLLYDSMERAALVAREGKNNLLRLGIYEKGIVITAASEIGTAREEVPAVVEGKELDISFNSRYFLDALRVIEDAEIMIDFTTAVSPCVVRPVEGDEYVYLLLPVRTYS